MIDFYYVNTPLANLDNFKENCQSLTRRSIIGKFMSISTAIARVTWPSLNYYQSPKSMIKVAKEFLESTQDDLNYYKKL